MANIFLSVPIHDRPELSMIFSMYQSILSCREHKVRLYYNQNDSLISRVRNVHASAFLNEFPECDYFMSIDSDILIKNCYTTNNIFTKLISHDVDFCGGLYAVKKQGERRCSSITIDSKEAEFNTGLKEMRWLSSGCWCLKRCVFEKMANAYPELLYDGDDNVAGKKIYGFYIPYIYKVTEKDLPPNEKTQLKLPIYKYLSEDWACIQRWRDIGGKVYADTSLCLDHIGRYEYSLYPVEIVQQQRPIPPEPGFDLKK